MKCVGVMLLCVVIFVNRFGLLSMVCFIVVSGIVDVVMGVGFSGVVWLIVYFIVRYVVVYCSYVVVVRWGMFWWWGCLVF